MKVSFIIPVFNEAATIGEVLARVDALDLDRQVIVVDDGSTDATAAIVDRWQAEHDDTLVLHQPNRGKGAAIRAAIPHVTGEIAIIQDADMEYDPVEVPHVVEPIMRGVADVVFGSRLSGGRPQRAYLFSHLVANRFLSLLTNVLFNTTISDMEVGFKAFRGDLVRSFRLVSNDFTFEPEVTAKVLRTPGVRLYEIPIPYYGRGYDEGKKITWRDGFKAVWALLRFRFARV
jgi:glycosyltransferase involved in cell wall biosynthesis